MGNNSGIKSNRTYYLTKKLIYIFMTNIYFLLAISPFILYFILAGSNLSIYILSFLGILIGPAISTVFSVLGRLIKGKETEFHKDFLYFYKLNFLQGIFASTIISIILLMSYLDIEYFFKVGINIVSYIFIGIAIFTLAISIYVFPIIARISAKTMDVFKLSIKLTLKKFYIPLTVLSVTIIALFAIKFLKIALIGVLFGPIALAYLILFLEKNILIEAEEYLREKYKYLTENKKIETEEIETEDIENEEIENEELEEIQEIEVIEIEEIEVIEEIEPLENEKMKELKNEKIKNK